MNHSFVVSAFLIFGFCKGLSQAGKEPVIIEIAASYAQWEGEPIQVKQDSLYRFGTGEVYLVNKRSFAAMKALYQNHDNSEGITQRLLENYDRTLRENLKLEKRLALNFGAADSLEMQAHSQTMSALSDAQRVLEGTITQLEGATERLRGAEQSIKRNRRKTAWQKVLLVAGGVGAGILIGVAL